VNTADLMQIALDLVGFDAVPEDSAIYVPGGEIRRVLFGVDIGAGELLMARQLGYDAVIVHHTVGTEPWAWRVFERHVDLLVGAGVPEEAAWAAVAPKREARRVSGQADNYEQVPMAARQLGMPFLNIHCPLDEMGRRVMQAAVDEALAAKSDATLDDIVGVLAALPAARRAATEVMVALGDLDARAGRVVVAHGALTNGGYHVARAYFDHGVDTVVYIHISPADLERLRDDGDGQLIVTGHVVGDAFGIEPYIHALRARGLEVDVLSEVLVEAE
jgi:putative NIF3 family GTP cyclohydrolase 1 type 2